MIDAITVLLNGFRSYLSSKKPIEKKRKPKIIKSLFIIKFESTFMKLYDARIDIIFKKNKFKIIIVPPIKGIFSV